MSSVERPDQSAPMMAGSKSADTPVDLDQVRARRREEIQSMRDAREIRLKAILRERHWQSVSAFHRAYDKAAAKIDPSLVGTAPQKAQFYRWLAGQIKGLPYPHHCEVLEAMLPGYTAAELFAPAPPARAVPSPEPTLEADHKERESHRRDDQPRDDRPRQESTIRIIGGRRPEDHSERMRALMSWVDTSATRRERDLRSAPDRRRSR